MGVHLDRVLVLLVRHGLRGKSNSTQDGPGRGCWAGGGRSRSTAVELICAAGMAALSTTVTSGVTVWAETEAGTAVGAVAGTISESTAARGRERIFEPQRLVVGWRWSTPPLRTESVCFGTSNNSWISGS